MFDLKKLEDNNATFWIFRFPEYRRIAAECGWAIAIHGSAVHDLDLMAMPWVEQHTSADELAQRLADTEMPNFRRPFEKTDPGDKPNGRIVYTIFAGSTYIDMNVIDYPSGDKAITMSKDEALERAYDLLNQFAKMDGTDVMAGLSLVSAKRDKDYTWMARQLGDIMDMFGELKKTLEG